MASTSFLLPCPSPASPRLSSPRAPFLRLFPDLSPPSPSPLRLLPLRSHRSRSPPLASVASPSHSPTSSPLQALIFDCDGVILESEHLHRQAYNDAFAHFAVRCPPSTSQALYWSSDFYDELQNRIGGGKPKMRWYFTENGWPSSSISETPPSTESDKERLIDILQDWKTERYKEIIKSGTVEPRPGVLQLMDDAKCAGVRLAVCSAATKSSVVLCLENLIGIERFESLDCFLAGDDVKAKKPDPSIYLTAAKKLGVVGKNCLVVEDSVIGLQAATGAGMPCLITYTPSTAKQDFEDAIATYPDLSNVSGNKRPIELEPWAFPKGKPLGERLQDLKLLLESAMVAN